MLLFCYIMAMGQGKIQRSQKHESKPNVEVSQQDGFNNGHGYIDLGLPSGTKWATCNIGASQPYKYGKYFAWGELDEKESYIESNCSTIGEVPYDAASNTKYDVAHCQWGSNWRLPSKENLQELIDCCEWKWCMIRGIAGYKIIGPNKKSIFLPAGDSKGENGSKGQFINTSGDYWSANSYVKGTSRYDKDNNPQWLTCSFGLFFFNKNADVRHYPRYFGRNVRPVF